MFDTPPDGQRIVSQYSNHSSLMLLSWGCIEYIEGLSNFYVTNFYLFDFQSCIFAR